MATALGLLLVAAIAITWWYSRAQKRKRERAEVEFPDEIPDFFSARVSGARGRRGDPDDRNNRNDSDAGDSSGGGGGGGD